MRVSFEKWLENLDVLCDKVTGMSIHDLPDQCYMDWYEDGLTTKQALKLVLSEM